MTLLILKGVVSGTLIVLVNLLAKRSPALAGVVVGFPMITLLSLLWLTVDQSPPRTIVEFITGVLWGLIPTFTFVLTIVLGLRAGASLPLAVVLGAVGWGIAVAVLVGAGRIAL